jgi:hypothetical protein
MTDVRAMADAELAGSAETDQDSKTVPGVPSEELFASQMTAPLVPLILPRGRLILERTDDVAGVKDAATKRIAEVVQSAPLAPLTHQPLPEKLLSGPRSL